jgi:hypothetical protein
MNVGGLQSNPIQLPGDISAGRHGDLFKLPTSAWTFTGRKMANASVGGGSAKPAQGIGAGAAGTGWR